MIFDSYLGPVLVHYGVKGMKWGVRRTPDKLGDITKSFIEKAIDSITMIDGIYHSLKGFVIDQRKFSGYCLKPGTDHSGEFFSVGYTPNDSDKLFLDMESRYDESKKIDSSIVRSAERFSIPMSLGMTSTMLFRTVWQKDKLDSDSRFITAYVDRRLEEMKDES